jgi:hypothetical protein
LTLAISRSATSRTAGAGEQRVADGLGLVAELLGEPHHGREASLAFVDLGGDAAAQRGLDHVVHIGGIEAVAGHRAAADVDGEVLLARQPFDPEILRAADLVHHPGDVVAARASVRRGRPRRS